MTLKLPRQYTRKIAAGAETTIKSPGQYFYCPEADQVAFVVDIDEKSQMIASAGRGWQAEPDDPPFNRLRIVNTGGAELNVTIEIGFGRPLDQRLTASGVVKVQGVAGGVPVSVAEAGPAASFASVLSKAAIANTYTKFQLFNPVASGKLLFVDRLTFKSTSAQVVFRSYDVQLAFFENVAIGRVDRRSPAPVAKLRWEQSAGQVGTTYVVFDAASGPLHRPSSPYVVGEGQGLLVMTLSLSATLETNFEWREETV